MKVSSVREAWITAKDASFAKVGKGAVKCGPNLTLPRKVEQFAQACSEQKEGARFAVEVTDGQEILCAIVNDGVPPRKALKDGSGIVWGLTLEMLEEMIEMLQEARQDYNTSLEEV